MRQLHPPSSLRSPQSAQHARSTRAARMEGGAKRRTGRKGHGSRQLLRFAVVQYMHAHRGGRAEVRVPHRGPRQTGPRRFQRRGRGLGQRCSDACLLAFGSGCGPPMGASGHVPARSNGLNGFTSHGNCPELVGSAVAGLPASGSVLGAWAAWACAALAGAFGSGFGLGLGLSGIARNPRGTSGRVMIGKVSARGGNAASQRWGVRCLAWVSLRSCGLWCWWWEALLPLVPVPLVGLVPRRPSHASPIAVDAQGPRSCRRLRCHACVGAGRIGAGPERRRTAPRFGARSNNSTNTLLHTSALLLHAICRPCPRMSAQTSRHPPCKSLPKRKTRRWPLVFQCMHSSKDELMDLLCGRLALCADRSGRK